MKLFLLRHAKARDTWPDHERELSDFGFNQAHKLAEFIDRAHFYDIAQIWHSPFTRARQTAEIFKNVADIPAELAMVETITPEDNPLETARVIASLSCFGKDLMIVSHNPFLENLTHILLSGSNGTGRVIFNTCTLAALTLEDIPTAEHEYGVWSLDFLVSPRVIR